MKKNSFQKNTKSLGYLIAGLLFAGNFFDALVNSKELISLKSSIWGTISVILIWMVLVFWMSKYKPYWGTGENAQRLLKPNRQINLFFVGFVILLWIPRGIDFFSSDEMVENEVKPVEINCNRDKDLGCKLEIQTAGRSGTLLGIFTVQEKNDEDINDTVIVGVYELNIKYGLNSKKYIKPIYNDFLFKDYDYIYFPDQMTIGHNVSPFKLTSDGRYLLIKGIIKDYKTNELLGWFDENEFAIVKPCGFSWNKDEKGIEIIDKYGNVCFSMDYQFPNTISFKGFFKYDDVFFIFNDKLYQTKDISEAETLISQIEPIFDHFGKNSDGKRLHPEIEPVYNSKFSNPKNTNILILPLKKYCFCKEKITTYENSIIKYFEESSKIKNSNFEIKVSTTKKEAEFYSAYELNYISKKTQADIIIYGNYIKDCDQNLSSVSLTYYLPNKVTNQNISLKSGRNVSKGALNNINLEENISVKTIENLHYWIQAEKAFLEKKYYEAITAYTEIINQSNYNDARLNHSIAFSYQSLLDYQKAINYYVKAISLDSLFYMSYNNRGNCYVNLRKIDSAKIDFNRVIQMTKGRYPDAFLNRGIMYLAKGDTSKALNDFNNAMVSIAKYGGRQELFSLISMNRGVLISMTGYPEKGISDIENARQYDPNNPELDFAIALCYLINKDFHKAENYNEIYLSKNPNSYGGLVLKSALLYARGYKKEARILENKNREMYNIEGDALFNFYGVQFYSETEANI